MDYSENFNKNSESRKFYDIKCPAFIIYPNGPFENALKKVDEELIQMY